MAMQNFLVLKVPNLQKDFAYEKEPNFSVNNKQLPGTVKAGNFVTFFAQINFFLKML